MAVALEKVLAEHARITFPLSEPWMQRAVEYCAEHLEEIRVFRALGLKAVLDPGRAMLILAWLHERDKDTSHEDYGFNVWLLDQCIGNTECSKEDQIFFRCMGCYKIRTNRAVMAGPCRCYGRRLNNCVGPMETQEILALLVTGR